MSVAIQNVLPSEALESFVAGKALNTQIAYRGAIERFTRWQMDQPSRPFVAQLRHYISHLQDAGLAAKSIRLHVSVIKGLLKEAAAIDTTGEMAKALPSLDLVKPPAIRGQLQGNRLTSDQRQVLINLPGITTHIGRRDVTIMLMLSLLGLRRSEVCNLNWAHISELDGHHVIKNLSGKHGRIRTIKLPIPVWRLLVLWADMAGLDRSPDSPVFVSIRRGDHIQPGKRLTGDAIAWIVQKYTGRLGIDGIKPHDLRRTAASLARKSGASIEQVQLLLGHASPQTTSQYIGETLDLDDNAVDYDGGLVYPGK